MQWMSNGHPEAAYLEKKNQPYHQPLQNINHINKGQIWVQSKHKDTKLL